MVRHAHVRTLGLGSRLIVLSQLVVEAASAVHET
jgi:hypothetical protein